MCGLDAAGSFPADQRVFGSSLARSAVVALVNNVDVGASKVHIELCRALKEEVVTTPLHSAPTITQWFDMIAKRVLYSDP